MISTPCLHQAMASVVTTAWDTRTALSSWAISPGLAASACVMCCSMLPKRNRDLLGPIYWVKYCNIELGDTTWRLKEIDTSGFGFIWIHET